MQSRKKKSDYRFSYVILGLILGFFLGSGIVYWYSNRQNDSFFAYNLWDYFAGLFQGSEKPSTFVVHETEFPPTNLTTTKSRAIQAILSDTLSYASITDSLHSESLNSEDISSLEETIFLPDSLPASFGQHADFQEIIPEVDQDEETEEVVPPKPIRIAQDKLLHIRAFSLPTKKPETTQNQALRQLDSLLGNNPRRQTTENMMLVEFWASPLNYRGYKMSHNKLVVYGLDQVESFSLHSDGKTFFIKYFDIYYPVSLTMDFKPLTSIIEPPLPEENLETWP